MPAPAPFPLAPTCLPPPCAAPSGRAAAGSPPPGWTSRSPPPAASPGTLPPARGVEEIATESMLGEEKYSGCPGLCPGERCSALVLKDRVQRGKRGPGGEGGAASQELYEPPAASARACSRTSLRSATICSTCASRSLVSSSLWRSSSFKSFSSARPTAASPASHRKAKPTLELRASLRQQQGILPHASVLLCAAARSPAAPCSSSRVRLPISTLSSAICSLAFSSWVRQCAVKVV